MKPFKTYECRFTVTGNGTFPFDMLRYDCCYPEGSDDAAKIGFDRVHAGKDEWLKPRTVNLISRSVNNMAPTAGRWESFNWRVTEIRN